MPNSDRLNILRNRASKYTNIENNVKFNFKKIISTARLIYIVMPIIITTLLIIAKPSFIQSKYYKNNMVTKRIDWKKLLVTIIILSIIVDVSIFAYRKSDN